MDWDIYDVIYRWWDLWVWFYSVRFRIWVIEISFFWVSNIIWWVSIFFRVYFFEFRDLVIVWLVVRFYHRVVCIYLRGLLYLTSFIRGYSWVTWCWIWWFRWIWGWCFPGWFWVDWGFRFRWFGWAACWFVIWWIFLGFRFRFIYHLIDRYIS
jgi:hypothetical protein